MIAFDRIIQAGGPSKINLNQAIQEEELLKNEAEEVIFTRFLELPIKIITLCDVYLACFNNNQVEKTRTDMLSFYNKHRDIFRASISESFGL